MVRRQGNVYIYDGFRIGIAAPNESVVSPFVHLSFHETDFDGQFEDLNLVHIFPIHEGQVDGVIDLIRKAKGSKIHIPTADEKRKIQ